MGKLFVLLSMALVIGPLLSAIDHCMNSSWIQGIERCDKCLTGFYPVNQAAACWQCMTKCLTCQSADVCLIYRRGYFLDQGWCKNCPANCDECSDISTCKSSNADAYMKGGVYSKCKEGYASCNNDPACIKCKFFYYMDGGNNCLKCLDNFESFTGPTRCTICDGGYTWNSENGIVKCKDTIDSTLLFEIVGFFGLILVAGLVCCLFFFSIKAYLNRSRPNRKKYPEECS